MSRDKSYSNHTGGITSHTPQSSSHMDGTESLSSFADFYDEARLAASRDACGIRGEGDNAYYSKDRPPSVGYRSVEERNPDNSLFTTEDRPTHVGDRLYKMGVQKEKLKAHRKEMNAERERSASADFRSVDPSDPYSSYEDRSTVACNRLYNTGIQKEKLKAQNLKDDVERSSAASADFRSFDPSDPHAEDRSTLACNRLYKMGIHNEKLKAQNLKQAKREEKLVNHELEISTRSYTPLKARPYERKINSLGNHSTVHNYLFYLSKDKQAEADREKADRERLIDEAALKEKVLTTKEKQKVVHRLYSRSRSAQHDGRERREKIAIALAPKPRARTKIISQDKASAFFDRQMAHKTARDQRIADAQVNRPPRSDGLNHNFDRNGERSQTPSRGRSMTPDRGRAPSAVRSMSSARPRTNGGRLKVPQIGSFNTRSASPSRNFRSQPDNTNR